MIIGLEKVTSTSRAFQDVEVVRDRRRLNQSSTRTTVERFTIRSRLNPQRGTGVESGGKNYILHKIIKIKLQLGGVEIIVAVVETEQRVLV